jgi:hypothetical protein
MSETQPYRELGVLGTLEHAAWSRAYSAVWQLVIRAQLSIPAYYYGERGEL